MRITFLGHVGLFVETEHGSVLCDPWFTPAYFGSWFVFPRNDALDPAPFSQPDYVYLSHLHRDHFDATWLAAHVDRNATVLLPAFGVDHLERALRDLGFTRFVSVPHGERIHLGGLEIAVLAYTSPADGPLGDSAIAIGDGRTRILNQNDARPHSRGELAALGPFDGQFVQFSGAIWYPVAYDFPPVEKAQLAADKRVNEMARARQYVEWVDAAHVFPCAGPPAFLDDGLWGLNDFDDAPDNIFPDQTVFLRELAAHGTHNGHLIVPGTRVTLEGAACTVVHQHEHAAVEPFVDKRAYLERYRADWQGWLDAEHASWHEHAMPHDALVVALHEWLAPLLERAPITSAGIAGNVVFDFGDETGVAIDFVESEVRAWKGDAAVYTVHVERALVETLVGRHETDWVNSLFLSARFVAHREGPFNEFVMTFFKALDIEKIYYVEARLGATHSRDQAFERDGWRIERWCPHRQADLAEYATIDGTTLTCALHHWQWDLETGACLTSDDPAKTLRCRRAPAQPG
jgi:UDP-MurNAc hydroxylase